MEEFKVAIVGGRDFSDYSRLVRCCDHMLQVKRLTHKIVIICGNARGADLLGARYGSARGYEVRYYKPDWDGLGKRAGMVRNEEMARDADAVIAFWDQKSRGTKHMIQHCQMLKKPVQIFPYGEHNG